MTYQTNTAPHEDQVITNGNKSNRFSDNERKTVIRSKNETSSQKISFLMDKRLTSWRVTEWFDFSDEDHSIFTKYSESENVFEYILQQDPYNRKAMEYLQSIATRVSVISEVEQQSARAQALAKIGQSWKDSPKVYKIEIDDDVKPTTTD